MFTLTLYFSSFLFLASADNYPYNPTDYFLLNCGISSNSTSWDGRNWGGDATSEFSAKNIASVSNESTASQKNYGVPYTTARIFHSSFTYTFPTSRGPKFVRLYFYPFDHSKSFLFNVTTAHYTLLTNFTASLDGRRTLIKEFIVTVDDNQLDVTFSPSLDSYAFINGIEVVSIPDDFYIRGTHQVTVVGQDTTFTIDDTIAFEKIYRFNVGGNDVGVNNDTGMFRTWVNDEKYIFGADSGVTPHLDIPIKYTTEPPNYTAPDIVYTTSRTMGNNSLRYNLTWIFPVDSGFYYMLRLYFCEIQPEVTVENQRVFTIFINNQMVEERADIIYWSRGRGIPVFRDYFVWIPQGRQNQQDLWLAMYPYGINRRYRFPQFYDALLNGLEIFKLSEAGSNLVGPNPEPLPAPNLSSLAQQEPLPAPNLSSLAQQRLRSKSAASSAAIIAGVIGGLAIFAILGLLVFQQRRRVKYVATTHAEAMPSPISFPLRPTKTNGASLPPDMCRRFSLDDIKSATGNFDDNCVIGSGGFGNVYKAYIDNDATAVAIKRLRASSNQGAHEFITEIEMLSKLRHLHLVSLIGYCDDNGEMVLVYDYMTRGTLRDHLYKSINPPLPWKQRLQICLGAARGIHYLHTGVKQTIIHRDVKTTNILLDEKWVAKVCDFGLSKMGSSDVSNTHISTVVKGTFGYLDPEYYRRLQLTKKSDVYSFGVVLFEVLCGRPAIDVELSDEQIGLAEWAQSCYRRGVIEQIIDPHIIEEIAPECLTKFGEIAYGCLQDQGINRPGMNDVVRSLELALLLQEDVEKVGYVSGNPNPYVSLLLQGDATRIDDECDMSSISTDYISMSYISDSTKTSSFIPFAH